MTPGAGGSAGTSAGVGGVGMNGNFGGMAIGYDHPAVDGYSPSGAGLRLGVGGGYGGSRHGHDATLEFGSPSILR